MHRLTDYIFPDLKDHQLYHHLYFIGWLGLVYKSSTSMGFNLTQWLTQVLPFIFSVSTFYMQDREGLLPCTQLYTYNYIIHITDLEMWRSVSEGTFWCVGFVLSLVFPPGRPRLEDQAGLAPSSPAPLKLTTVLTFYYLGLYKYQSGNVTYHWSSCSISWENVSRSRSWACYRRRWQSWVRSSSSWSRWQLPRSAPSAPGWWSASGLSS